MSHGAQKSQSNLIDSDYTLICTLLGSSFSDRFGMFKDVFLGGLIFMCTSIWFILYFCKTKKNKNKKQYIVVQMFSRASLHSSTLTSLISKPLSPEHTVIDKELKAKRMCKQYAFSFNQAQVLTVSNVHTCNWVPQQCEMLMHMHVFRMPAMVFISHKVTGKYPLASCLCSTPFESFDRV